MKKKKIELTEQETNHKKWMLEDDRLKLDGLKIEEQRILRALELKIPEREARNRLFQIRNEINRLERETKILTKQIRERSQEILDTEN